MPNLGNVIKLTRTQYEQLLAGTLTGHTYDSNAIYLIESEYQDYILETIRWIYPIGSIYINYTGVKPAWMDQIGTWQAITDRFLLMAGSTYNPIDTGGTSSRTGGKASVTLSASIGATGNNPSQIGYITEGAIPYQLANRYGYNVGGTGSTSITSSTAINHSTPVTENTGTSRSTSIMPPYEIVFGWRRIA